MKAAQVKAGVVKDGTTGQETKTQPGPATAAKKLPVEETREASAGIHICRSFQSLERFPARHTFRAAMIHHPCLLSKSAIQGRLLSLRVYSVLNSSSLVV